MNQSAEIRAREGAGAPAERASPGAAAPVHVPGRDRYLDLLRALALVRVVVYHTFGGALLSLVFPAMGIMFALAGSLMARSLERPAGTVLRSRTRRLLLPLWVYSATVLALFVLSGWTPGEQGTGPWYRVLLWFVPLADPPYPESLGDGGAIDASWPVQAGEILWYLRAYLWFVLLSPLLRRMFRARPWPTLVAPLVLLLVLEAGIVPLSDAASATLTDIAVFGSCWLLGFAHHDGLLRSLPWWFVLTAAPFAMGLGLCWALTHPTEEGLDLNAIPIGQALWSFGFCALLLRISPSWQVLPRPLRFLDPVVTLLNNRAVTVYLWHNLLLVLTVPLLDPLYSVDLLWDTAPWLLEGLWLDFLLTWVLVAGVIVAVGWVEDIAAKRRPRLWPASSRSAAPGRQGG
ncbi:membrane protein [Kocuria dechangensis]|uniref:Membrane protein n=1 Tax=Kocuria dechangensis TaxID=1176249 RepID=A0A917GF74_9MICC|nr:acyltransferase family protein [Kocuria dechangensis]GGG43317.1 membrane protein [Kocuria dechangensis]